MRKARLTAGGIAAALGVSEAQIKAQFARNAAQLRDCARTAANVRGMYRGKTERQWGELADYAEEQAR